MGHQSLVYGAIEVPVGDDRSALEAQAKNRNALDSLPSVDGWPFLIRAMFSQTFSADNNVQYAFGVIHFGASYKEVEEEWASWVGKFEKLLSQMRGAGAVVHLESERFGNHKLEWLGSFGKASPSESEAWSFVGGPRSFHALAHT